VYFVLPNGSLRSHTRLGSKNLRAINRNAFVSQAYAMRRVMKEKKQQVDELEEKCVDCLKML